MQPVAGRGNKRTGHKAFTIAIRVQMPACDLRSPWRRGKNLTIYELLRWYLPRSMDCRPITLLRPHAIVPETQHPIGRTLDWATAAQTPSAVPAAITCGRDASAGIDDGHRV